MKTNNSMVGAESSILKCAFSRRLGRSPFDIRLFILIIFPAVAPFSFSQTNTSQSLPLSPAEYFKHFVSKPPVIKHFIVSQYANKPMFYCIRLQTNALFFGSYGTNPPLPTLNPMHFRSYTARYGNRYWHKSGNYITSYTNRYDPNEKGNIVEWQYQFAVSYVAQFLHMGFGGYLPLDSIRWTNDTFVVTNVADQVVIRGRLERDADDFVSIMYKEVFSIKTKEMLSRSSSHCTYNTNITLLPLPHRCETRIFKGDKMTGSDISHYWHMELSDEPLPEIYYSLLSSEAEALKRNYVSNAFIVTVDGSNVVFDLDSVRFKPDVKYHQPPSNMMMWIIITLAFIPLPIYLWQRRKQKYTIK